MEQIDAVLAFSTLGHPGRLSVFRLLMRFAPNGVRPTEIAEALGLKQNTLSHHLSDLETAGLIQGERQGRSLFYSVRFDRMTSLVRYLVDDCCRGRPDICASASSPQWQVAGQRPMNVLFVCSGNSARSIMAEAILRDLGPDRFAAHSAGTHPAATVNSAALDLLGRAGHEIAELRPKPLWSFEGPAAPRMDFVFTVCDRAAAEDCPPWPGLPMAAYWGVPDPAKNDGEDERARAFVETYAALDHRIRRFAALPMAELDKGALQHQLDLIGAG